MITDADFDQEVEKHLAYNAQEKPPKEGRSRFIHEYALTYDRMLPRIIMFEDVRDAVWEKFDYLELSASYDNQLTWISFHVFFERMLLPLCREYLESPTVITFSSRIRSRNAPLWMTEQMGLKAYEPYRTNEESRDYFAPLNERLNEIEDEGLVTLMEKLFVMTDKGQRLMEEHFRQRFNRALSFTRFYLKQLMQAPSFRSSGVPGRRLGVLFAL